MSNDIKRMPERKKLTESIWKPKKYHMSTQLSSETSRQSLGIFENARKFQKAEN